MVLYMYIFQKVLDVEQNWQVRLHAKHHTSVLYV